MIPNTAGSNKFGDDSTGMGTSFSGNSTFNGDASLRTVRTRSQERTQYQVEKRNPHSQTETRIVEIGLVFGAAVIGIWRGAVAVKGILISATVEIGTCVIPGAARHSNRCPMATNK